MILVQGMPFEPPVMWPSNIIEHVIFQKMQEDKMVYSYDSIEALAFELNIRRNIIESARAMNQGHARFESFKNARCNPQYWELTNAGGFLLRRGVQPADAIRDIFINSYLYAFECATAIIIIYYHAVLNSIPEHVFNQLFNDLYLYSWHSDTDLRIINVDSSHLIPGDVVYFNNPDYNPVKPWWQGENAVVLEDGSYFGHGIGVKSAEQIIDGLNKQRKPGSSQSAYLMKTVTRLSTKHLANYGMFPRSFIPQKFQLIPFHHNEKSIPFHRYLYYLNKFYSEGNDKYLY